MINLGIEQNGDYKPHIPNNIEKNVLQQNKRNWFGSLQKIDYKDMVIQHLSCSPFYISFSNCNKKNLVS
jgi:ribosome maturation factor RimP